MVRIVSILGTGRPASLTARALGLVTDALRQHPDVELIELDGGSLTLPFPGQPGAYPDVERIHRVVSAASGVVLATPEYQGSYTALIKLVIENLGYPSALAGKPVALLGVASGRIGAIKAIEHLRGVCCHLGAIPVPGAVSLAQVHRVFDPAGRCVDAAVPPLAAGLASALVELARALERPATAAR